ncbi:MAG: GH92 family glycosyl hydrolase [Bacteroidaceae bacterium]|nr:GH92 family glycosyl hydrolase [Bacteroidaceae bacterium]
MHRFLIHILSLFLIIPSLFAEGVTQYVNPLMGTTTLWTPEELGFVPKPGERQWGAETFPGAALPNAMVQLTPVTQYRSGSGYQYEDSLIYGFAHTSKGHWNLLHLPILPVTEEGKPTPQSYASAYHHDREEAHPGYYQVFLDRYNVNAELTTTLRCGYHRYTFRESDHKALLIDIARSNNMPRRWELKQAGTNAIEGFQDGEGRIYFYGELSEEIESVTEEGRSMRDEGRSMRDEGRSMREDGRGRNFSRPIGMVKLKKPNGSKPLELKIGFSFVNIENARENLKAELSGKSFEEVRRDADKVWNDILGHIQVEGGTEADRKMLYSTLYRTFLFPHLRTDVNGESSVEHGEVKKLGYNYYTNPSFWDTYRNKLILLGMITPDVARDIIRSCIERGETRGGYMPTFFHGDHASTFVSGSWLRGIRDFDLQRAYALMLKNATVPGRGGRPYLDEYLERGWISEKDTVNVPTGDEYKGAVTKTLEFAYDDYATALVARELGDKANEQLLLKHSQNYKTLFDPSTGFWRGKVLRDGKGLWIEDFRPNYPYYQYQYREADAWNSLFFAPHDPMGMVALYPSRQAVEQKLDSLFTVKNGGYPAFNCTGYLGLYCHGNQPGHSIPFTYYFIDRQEKAQHVLNTLMHKYYGMGKEGLAYAGMDDAGEMSSWFVLNAIGIYTYSPADPEYIVTVPLFDKVHFTLGDGQRFDIIKQGKGEKIKRITIGGTPLKGWFVKHEDLAKGKELLIVCGD